MSEPQKVLLITGASSGLGLAMAQRWKLAQYRVIAVSRQAPPPGIADDFICADLSQPGAPAEVMAEFSRRESRLDLLINNAGIGAYAAWCELPEAEWRRLMEIDLFAPVELSRLALPWLRETQGAIVNISSVAGLAPVPGMGAYSAAKFALLAFSETLGAECRRWGIHVLTVCPGRIGTGFSNRAVTVRPSPETPLSGCSSPEGLAERVWRAVRAKKRRVIYPAWYWFFIQFTRLFPRFYEKQAVKVWKLDV